MARGKKIVDPAHRRYYVEGGYESSVYVVEIGQMVKVGRSATPCRRLRDLHTQHGRCGESLGRFQLFPVRGGGHIQTYIAEAQAIRALTDVCEPVAGHLEYFAGIDYDTAVTVVRDVLAASRTPA